MIQLQIKYFQWKSASIPMIKIFSIISGANPLQKLIITRFGLVPRLSAGNPQTSLGSRKECPEQSDRKGLRRALL